MQDIYLAVKGLNKVMPVSMKELWQEFYFRELHAGDVLAPYVDMVM